MARGSSAGQSTVSRASYLVRMVMRRYLTDWLSLRNDFVSFRTLIRGKDAWPYAIGRVSDKASDTRRLPNGSLTAEHENDR